MADRFYEFIYRRFKWLLGFSLIEVLIGLTIFAFSILGVALYTGNTIQMTHKDSTRILAVMACEKSIAHFPSVIARGKAAFLNALLEFDQDGDSGNGYQRVVEIERQVFSVRLKASRDFNGVNILENREIQAWTSPIQIAVETQSRDDPGVTILLSYTYVF